MARDALTAIPSAITAGDTVVIELSSEEFPPSEGWTGSAAIVLASEQKAPTVTDDDQGTYTITIGASLLQTIVTQQEARFVFRVTGSGAYANQVYTVCDYPITILPNVTNATGKTSRSDDEIELDAVKAAILALTTTNIASYSIGGRSVQRNEIRTLYSRQAILEARIRGAKGYGPRKRVVAFG